METSTGLQVRAAQSARMSTLDRPLICPMPFIPAMDIALMDTGSVCQTNHVLIPFNGLDFDFLTSFAVKAFHSSFKALDAVEIKPGVIE